MHSLLQSELVTVKHKLSLHFKKKKHNKGGLVENMEGMIDFYTKRQSIRRPDAKLPPPSSVPGMKKPSLRLL